MSCLKIDISITKECTAKIQVFYLSGSYNDSHKDSSIEVDFFIWTDHHVRLIIWYTAQKMKFSIKDFFTKCDHIHSFLWIWSHLVKKSSMKNFIFVQRYFLAQMNYCIYYLDITLTFTVAAY